MGVAFRLLALLPPHRSAISGTTFNALWSLVPVLEARGVGGDRFATAVAFRLLHFSDAAFGEELEVSLGQVATARPQVFLRCLAVARAESSPGQDPVRVVAAFDPDLSATERQVARDRRVRCLQSVSDPPIRDLRDECIQLLAAQEQGQHGAT
jgi:hypothetical protein